jgi:hypothetical protein
MDVILMFLLLITLEVNIEVNVEEFKAILKSIGTFLLK